MVLSTFLWPSMRPGTALRRRFGAGLGAASAGAEAAKLAEIARRSAVPSLWECVLFTIPAMGSAMANPLLSMIDSAREGPPSSPLWAPRVASQTI